MGAYTGAVKESLVPYAATECIWASMLRLGITKEDSAILIVKRDSTCMQNVEREKLNSVIARKDLYHFVDGCHGIAESGFRGRMPSTP